MRLLWIYSLLLVLGIILSQTFDLSGINTPLTTLTLICLAYIMIEVGLDFSVNKRNLKQYGWDYIVAMTAAAIPWIICAVYFIFLFNMQWSESLVLGRFAAPTSAGILFAMLTVAGLRKTWLFKKVRLLAIFDDLDTILFMIPLQFLLAGSKPQLAIVGLIAIFFIIIAYKWLDRLRWPTGRVWLLSYGILIVLVAALLEKTIHVSIEVILPAFALGCILHHAHHEIGWDHGPEIQKKSLMRETRRGEVFDNFIRGFFMFLVGCSLPRIEITNGNIDIIIFHVILITILINLGKCFPIFCYRKEATLKERIAVSVAMFPRGEVGAGVLVIAMSYGVGGLPAAIAGFSLVLNLLLTGIFVFIVIGLTRKTSLKK